MKLLAVLTLINLIHLSQTCDFVTDPVGCFNEVKNKIGDVSGTVGNIQGTVNSIVGVTNNLDSIFNDLKTFVEGIQDRIHPTGDINEFFNEVSNKFLNGLNFQPIISKISEIDPTNIIQFFIDSIEIITECLNNPTSTIDLSRIVSPFYVLPTEMIIPFCISEKIIDKFNNFIDIEFVNDRWNELKSLVSNVISKVDLFVSIMTKFRTMNKISEQSSSDDINVICSEVNEHRFDTGVKGYEALAELANFVIEVIKSVIEVICGFGEAVGDTFEAKGKTFPDVGGFVGIVKTPRNYWSIASGIIKPLDAIPSFFESIKDVIVFAQSVVCEVPDEEFIEENEDLRSILRKMAEDYNEFSPQIHEMVEDYNSIKETLHEMINDYLTHKENKTIMENTYITNLQNTTIMINSFVNNLVNNTKMINDYVSLIPKHHNLIDSYLCNQLNFTRTLDDYVNHNRLYILNPKPENGNNICLIKP